MHRDIQLPPIFTDNNICTLDGYELQMSVTPARTVGSAWFSTQLSAMKTRVLRLRLNEAVHSFVEAKNTVNYEARGQLSLRCSPRVIGVRRIQTRRSVTLILIDEKLERPIAVIGDALSWEPEGLDVRLVCGRDEVLL